MRLISFNAGRTRDKFPASPYDDNSFNFSPLYVSNLADAFKILATNFTLTHDLEIKKTFRLTRKNKDLKPLLAMQNYLVLDIDCQSRDNLNKILDYFKDFSAVIGESRSFNNVDNFNIKGILEIEESNDIDYYKIFKKIQRDLSSLGYLDERILNAYHFIYPIDKIKILQNTRGKKYPRTIKETRISDIIELESQNTRDMCDEYFLKLGFTRSESGFSKNGIEYKRRGNYILESKGEIINIYDAIENYTPQKINELISKYTPNEIVNYQYLDETSLNLKKLLKNYDVVCLKSCMGSKKSEVIKQVIKSKSRILIITSRISLALEFNNKFELPVYLNVNFKKTSEYHRVTYKPGMSLICQYDSLHKINPRDFDIVVLDEYVSLLLHSIDNLSKLKKENLTKFKMLLNKKLIISDAFLCDYILDFFDNKKVYKIENTGKFDKDLVKFETKKDFTDAIKTKLSNGEKITISTSSISSIYKDIEDLCRQYDKNIIAIQGETEHDKKSESVNEFNNKGVENDIIMYSPAVTIGVSIFKDINNHFHYDGSNSIDSIQSVQMLGRPRLVKTFNYFVQERHQYMKPDTQADIQWEIEHRYKNSDNSFYFELDDEGNVKMSELGHFYLRIKNYRRFLNFNTTKSFESLLACNFRMSTSDKYNT